MFDLIQIRFEPKAEKVYKKLLRNDKQVIAKIKSLLESIRDDGYDAGLGHPERLKGYEERWIYSRHINEKDRLTYEIVERDDGELLCIILTFKGHYDDH